MLLLYLSSVSFSVLTISTVNEVEYTICSSGWKIRESSVLDALDTYSSSGGLLILDFVFEEVLLPEVGWGGVLVVFLFLLSFSLEDVLPVGVGWGRALATNSFFSLSFCLEELLLVEAGGGSVCAASSAGSPQSLGKESTQEWWHTKWQSVTINQIIHRSLANI